VQYVSSLASHAVLIALVCGVLAVAYGVALTRWVLSRPAGTERMQEIAAAIQEGAAAYLKASVHHHRGCGGRRVPGDRNRRHLDIRPGLEGRDRVPDRGGALGAHGLHRD